MSTYGDDQQDKSADSEDHQDGIVDIVDVDDRIFAKFVDLEKLINPELDNALCRAVRTSRRLVDFYNLSSDLSIFVFADIREWWLRRKHNMVDDTTWILNSSGDMSRVEYKLHHMDHDGGTYQCHNNPTEVSVGNMIVKICQTFRAENGNMGERVWKYTHDRGIRGIYKWKTSGIITVTSVGIAGVFRDGHGSESDSGSEYELSQFRLAELLPDQQSGSSSSNSNSSGLTKGLFEYNGEVPRFSRGQSACSNVIEFYDNTAQSMQSRQSVNLHNVWIFGGLKFGARRKSDKLWLFGKSQSFHEKADLKTLESSKRLWRLCWDQNSADVPIWQECRIVADSDEGSDLHIARSAKVMLYFRGLILLFFGTYHEPGSDPELCNNIIALRPKSSLREYSSDTVLQFDAYEFVMAQGLGNCTMQSYFDNSLDKTFNYECNVTSIGSKLVFLCNVCSAIRYGNVAADSCMSLYLYDSLDDKFSQISFVNVPKPLSSKYQTKHNGLFNRGRVATVAVGGLQSNGQLVININLKHQSIDTESGQRSFVYRIAFSDNLADGWSPDTHADYSTDFRQVVFHLLLMHYHDQYDNDELNGFEWNMLPWEIIERIIGWLALFDVESRKKKV